MTLATMWKGRLVGPARMVCRTVVSARAVGIMAMVMVMVMAIRASILEYTGEEEVSRGEESESGRRIQNTYIPSQSCLVCLSLSLSLYPSS